MCVSLSRCFSSSFWLSIYLVVWELFRLFDGYWAHVRTILPIFIRQYLHRVMTDLCIMNLICDNVRRRVERRRRRKKGSTDLILCILSDRERERNLRFFNTNTLTTFIPFVCLLWTIVRLLGKNRKISSETLANEEAKTKSALTN